MTRGWEGAFVRVAGLPWNAAHGLRVSDTVAVLHHRDEVEAQLQAQAETISGQLHAAIGNTPADARGPLIALRRSLHNRLDPSPRLWNGSVQENLGASLSDSIAAYIALIRESRRLRQALDDTFPTDLAKADAHIRKLMLEPAFARGIAMSSPVLHKEATTWAELGGRIQLQTRVKLAKFAARAVAKTSPFSSFMFESPLKVDRHARGFEGTGQTLAWKAYVEPSIAAILSDQAAAPPPCVRPHPSVLISGGRIYHVSRHTGEWAVLDWTQQTDAYPFPDQDATTAYDCRQIEVDPRTLRFLLNAGIAVPHPDLRVNLEDRRWWEKVGTAENTVRLAPAVETDTRAVLSATEELKQDAGPQGRRPTAGIRDNAVLEYPLVVANPESLERLTERLRAVYEVLRRLDPLEPWRIAVAEQFHDHLRTSTTLPWLEFDCALAAQSRAQDGPGTYLNLLLDPRHRLMSAAWDAVPHGSVHNRRMQTWGTLVNEESEGSGRVSLPVERVLERLNGDFPHRIDSLSCYLQLLDRSEHTDAVLNEMKTGYGRGLSRSAWVCGVGRAAQSASPGTERLIELGCLFGNNLTIRRLQGPVLDFPVGNGSLDGELVHPKELRVALDPETGRLRLQDQTGRAVRLINSSAIADDLLPRPLRRAIALFGGTDHLLHSGIAAAAARPVLGGQGIAHSDRVALDTIVICRESWMVPARALPSGTDPATLSGWLAWRERVRALGLPGMFYVRRLNAGIEGPLHGKDRKPLYVDMGSPYLVRNLETLTREPSAVLIITECLPDESDGLKTDDGNRHWEMLLGIRANGE